jgi:hypothetical protein
VYVDDVLATSHEPKVLIDAIGEYYKVKPKSDKEPDIYLGANVEKVQMLDGREVWATSPHDYIKNAIKTVKGLLAEDREGYVLKNKMMNPFSMNYQPKLDVSNELGLELPSCYLQLIGIVRWAIELGCINIHHFLFVVTVSSKSKGRTFGGSVSCVCIYEKSFGYRSCCI